MATDLSFVEYIAEQSRLESSLTWKKMFGEYALYLGGKVVAFACDNSLFIKASPETAALTAALPGRPPYPGAKDYPVADELLDEPDQLRALLLATERAMPLPKVKGAAKRVKASKAVKKAPAMKAPAKNAAAQKTASKTTPAKKPASTKTATRKRPVR
ncbi:MAG TPA: TfoX/Sxy family protein [Tahibacter sp.]|uniref:TfoX/Sxy family protein n=1 Tax=Tahibacter sp. TaxID=2056211 RepID=UPI002B7013BC|nr:TfoX/Sxy family protein [Tahibacter sp.]HSX58948.1 TfoX/Sxy family protein [Tahibacter sp.]